MPGLGGVAPGRVPVVNCSCVSMTGTVSNFLQSIQIIMNVQAVRCMLAHNQKAWLDKLHTAKQAGMVAIQLNAGFGALTCTNRSKIDSAPRT